MKREKHVAKCQQVEFFECRNQAVTECGSCGAKLCAQCWKTHNCQKLLANIVEIQQPTKPVAAG